MCIYHNPNDSATTVHYYLNIIFFLLTLFIHHSVVGDNPGEDMATGGSDTEVVANNADASESTVIFLQCSITCLELGGVC